MKNINEFQSSTLLDFSPAHKSILEDVLAGLSGRRKTLPPKLLYDKRGSEIFEKICDLPSYYPTRTEAQILRENAPEMAELIGENAILVEPGSGAAEKVRILFREFSGTIRYVPYEISREILLRTTRGLLEEFPGMEVYPVCADFTRGLVLPVSLSRKRGKKVVFFPGSTIGNLDAEEALKFLKNVTLLTGKGGALLIGVDMKKDPRILYEAYNDPQGVTAAFNLNLLERLNREVDATFDPTHFRHEAIYNEELGRIEMHLQSLLPQIVRVDQRMFTFGERETIHTENSYKYSVEEFTALGMAAGLTPVRSWQDKDSLFSVYYFEVR